MKLNQAISITISFFALLMVLIIQVNWILQTAKNKEELFNEKANIVLSRTTETLLTDKEASSNIEASIDSASGSTIRLEKKEFYKIDSLLTHYMHYYNFNTNYSFKIIKSSSPIKPIPYGSSNEEPPPCHEKSLNEMTNKSGWKLILNFPSKKQFIITEMGPMFITSVVLIITVLFFFWRTVQSLIKEKKISEHTTDFLNNMTHEFKTPLTNIALAGKMVAKDSTDKIKHYSEIILEENEKLRLQVEQVLSMTALERGEIPLQKTKLNFHELTHKVLKQMSLQIENKQGNLKLNLEAHQFVIMGDKTHLTNVFCNIIDNAIKYAKENPEIFIKTYNDNQKLIITVKDNGIGIAKEYRGKIFDKFFRIPTGDLHDVKGFGLGLAYVKKIIELHGGNIELTNTESQSGVTFTITLPYV